MIDRLLKDTGIQLKYDKRLCERAQLQEELDDEEEELPTELAKRLPEAKEEKRFTPHRIKARAQEILTEHRKSWVRWRCEKIAELFREIRDAMLAHKSDLLICFRLYGLRTAVERGFDWSLLRDEERFLMWCGIASSYSENVISDCPRTDFPRLGQASVGFGYWQMREAFRNRLPACLERSEESLPLFMLMHWSGLTLCAFSSAPGCTQGWGGVFAKGICAHIPSAPPKRTEGCLRTPSEGFTDQSLCTPIQSRACGTLPSHQQDI